MITKLEILKSLLRIFIAFEVVFAITMHSYANNISISNVSLPTQVAASNYTIVEFDVSWDNSWRTSTFESNWDAAWIFVKYRLKTNTIWSHATIDTVGYSAPAGSTIDVPSDGMGAFIYRDANGTGTVNFTDAQLRWMYGVDGLDDDDSVEICVMAIEMVYVPEGSFYIGSGGTSPGEFYEYPAASQEFNITSEASITVGTSAGNLYYSSGVSTGDQAGPILATFPKGYDDFYCMKYEVTQEQYVSFLNKLTYTQQAARTANAPNSVAGTGAFIDPLGVRNAIVVETPGTASNIPAVYACNLDGDGIYDESDDGQNISCNYLSWYDLLSYSDWVGLRPMSELEYEKACRGTASPLADEYAWGDNSLTSSAYTLSNDGAANEGITTNYNTTDGNASYNTSDGTINGPLRVGIFAAHVSNTGRNTSGATYWGIMEMSGNLSEWVITSGTSQGRSFTGDHGNGELGSTGAANTPGWIIHWSSAGYRGGSWGGTELYLRVSNRDYLQYSVSGRSGTIGGRGVRTAP